MASSQESLDKSLRVSNKFFTDAAKPLQAKLIEIDKSKYSSFIAEPWFDMYLKNRQGLMINLNPQLSFNDCLDPKRMEQKLRATDLIYSSLKFYKTLKELKLTPDIFHTKPDKSKTKLFENIISLVPKSFSFQAATLFGAFPLDMSQYKNLFSSTRIPKNGKVTLSFLHFLGSTKEVF